MKRSVVSWAWMLLLVPVAVSAQNTGDSAPALPPIAPEPLAPAPLAPAPSAEGSVTESPLAPVSSVPDEPHSLRPEPRESLTPALTLEPELREVPRWYGGETLLVDAVSLVVALFATAAQDAAEPFLLTAAAGYLLGAPIVHAAHDNWGRAGLSLALRVAFPAAFVGMGLLIEDCSNNGGDFCGLASIVIGVPLGMLTAIIVDATVLARDTVREPAPVQPLVGVRRDALWLGLRANL